jgi:hypothetical protein
MITSLGNTQGTHLGVHLVIEYCSCAVGRGGC